MGKHKQSHSRLLRPVDIFIDQMNLENYLQDQIHKLDIFLDV